MLRTSAAALELDADVGNVPGAGFDVHGLRPAVGGQRKGGSESGGSDLAHELTFGDAAGHVTRHIAVGFPPVSLDRIPRGFGVALNVELEALAGADDRLIKRRAVLSLR